MKPVAVVFAAILFVSIAAGGAPLGARQAPAQGTGAGSGVVGGGLLVTDGRGRRGGGPARPAPRDARGRVLLQGANAKDKGVWLPGPGITGVPVKPIDQLPLLPWARSVFADRQINEFEPHTRCKPSGVAREFQTPYGVEFVELPEQQKIYIFDIGGPHTFRTIYMDGRSHPTDGLPERLWSLDRMVGRRYARFGLHQLPRRVLARSQGSSAHRAAPYAGALDPEGLHHDGVHAHRG